MLGCVLFATLHAETTTYIPLSAACPPKPKRRRAGCLGTLMRPAPRKGFNARFNAVAMAPETPVAPAPGAEPRALSPLVRRTYSDSDEG